MKFGRTGLAVLGLFAVAAVGCPQPSHKTFNDAGDESGGEGGDGSGGSTPTGGKTGGTGGSTGGSSGSTGGSSGDGGSGGSTGGSGGSTGGSGGGGSGGAKMDGGAGMGGGDGGGGASGGASMAGFMAVYTGVIMPKCGPCHITGTSGGLAMPNANTAFTNLVGKASACAGMMRVTAGDPTKSVLSLIVKGGVMGCASRGAQMPKGRTALSAAEIKMIDDWIKGP